MRTIDSKDRYYSLDELAGKLNLGINTVSEYLKDNKFPNAFKLSTHKGRWHIPQKDVVDFMQKDEKYKKLKKAIDILENSEEEYLTVRQVAETLNKTEETIRIYIRNKIFPNVLSLSPIKGGHYIPSSDLGKYIDEFNSSYSTKKAKSILKIHEETLLKWLKSDNGLFKGAYKISNGWRISKNEVDGLIDRINDSYTVSEVMGHLKIARNTTLNWAKNRKFPNAFKVGTDWRIPKNDLHEIRDKQLTIKEVQEILDIGDAAIYKWVNDGTFPNAKKSLGGWTIPRDDIDTYLYKKSLLCTAKEAAVMLEVDLNTVRK